MLRVGIVSDDLNWKILFLGSVRSRRILVATKEKITADGERAARFEKVRGGNIVNFQDLRREEKMERQSCSKSIIPASKPASRMVSPSCTSTV